MSNKEMIEALAEGIKGEIDGMTVYREAAERSSGEVKAFFLQRAADEKLHYQWISEYYRRLLKDEDIEGVERGKLPEGQSPVFSEDFLTRVGTDRYLSAAISSSILLEYNSIEHYRKSAEEAELPEVAELFRILTGWETEHYESLLKIQEESRRIWFAEQGFEPY